MSMMHNRVQSLSHEVGSVIVGWYIRKSEGLADEMYSCEMVGYVDMVSSTIVDRVLRNVDAQGIICHNRQRDAMT